MSQNSPFNANSAEAVPFNNEVNNWTAPSIVGVVATVLGFIAIILFVFWLFRRESRIRREDAEASSEQNLILHTAV
jgi:flagellar biosynthesis/type III secretory pathway M-ring protein FliF/YscJ